jgi:hypothetical protein
MMQEHGFWQAHVEAAKREGTSTSAYAKRHAVPLKSLYRWQRKLAATSAAIPSAAAPTRFVALRVAEAVKPLATAKATPTSSCVLELAPGMRLEMATLPPPQWLAAIVCAAQGAS